MRSQRSEVRAGGPDLDPAMPAGRLFGVLSLPKASLVPGDATGDPNVSRFRETGANDPMPRLRMAATFPAEPVS